MNHCDLINICSAFKKEKPKNWTYSPAGKVIQHSIWYLTTGTDQQLLLQGTKPKVEGPCTACWIAKKLNMLEENKNKLVPKMCHLPICCL